MICKTLADSWSAYERLVIPEDASVAMKRSIRLAFCAGAIAVKQLTTNAAVENRSNSSEAARIVKELYDDIERMYEVVTADLEAAHVEQMMVDELKKAAESM